MPSSGKGGQAHNMVQLDAPRSRSVRGWGPQFLGTGEAGLHPSPVVALAAVRGWLAWESLAASRLFLTASRAAEVDEWVGRPEHYRARCPAVLEGCLIVQLCLEDGPTL